MLPDLGKGGIRGLGDGQPKPPSPGWPRSWHTQVPGGQGSREEVVYVLSSSQRNLGEKERKYSY